MYSKAARVGVSRICLFKVGGLCGGYALVVILWCVGCGVVVWLFDSCLVVVVWLFGGWCVVGWCSCGLRLVMVVVVGMSRFVLVGVCGVCCYVF